MHDNDELFATNASAFLKLRKNIPQRFTNIRTDIILFLNNQPDFDIRNTSVETAAASPGAMKGIKEENVQAVISALCEMQRTLAFTTTPTEFQVVVRSCYTSALKMASIPLSTLKRGGHIALGGWPTAKKIHDRATSILHHNQRTLTALHQAVRGSGIVAVDGPYSSKDRLRICGNVAGHTIKNIDLEKLFGAMDSDPCDDCNSVTSPAAYFVEILQFLRNNNLEPGNPGINGEDINGTALESLFARRPDLGDLQLTCPNTNTILPYIDLANEVMESFIVHLTCHAFGELGNVTKAKLDVHNSSATAGKQLSEPQYTNFEAYSILSTKLFPFHQLPYNQALDEARIFLKHLGTSRYELLETCYPDRSTPKNYDNAMIAGYLNLTHEEYLALTGDDAEMPGLKKHEEWEYWGYKDQEALLKVDESTHTGLRFIKAQFLPRSGIQFSDLVDLLSTDFINPLSHFEPGKMIVILHHGEQDMRYRLVHSNGSELETGDYRRIRQFIHLWHRIGWTIDETDRAISGLLESNKGSEINSDVLRQLVSVLKLLEITKLERSKLLTFWSPISMRGADSLYSRLFLINGANRADPVLKLDENRSFLESAEISKHEPLVMSTLGLTKEGLDALRVKLVKHDLSIANLSFLYRHSLMARILGVTPSVLLEAINDFGNPFISPSACLTFINRWKQMGEIGFTFAQLRFVVTGVDNPVEPLGLSEKRIEATIASLRGGISGLLNIMDTTTENPADNANKTDLVHTSLSKTLGLSIAMTEVLLDKIQIDGEKALEAVLSITSTEKKEPSIPLFNLLSRAALLIIGFKLSAAEVSWAFEGISGLKEFNDHGLLLHGWESLLAYTELRDSLPKGVDGSLLDLLHWIPEPEAAAEEQAATETAAAAREEADTEPAAANEEVRRIANLMLVQEGMVRTLMMNFVGLRGKSYRDIGILTKLKKACDLAKKLAIDADSLLSWASPRADFEHTHRVAQAIRGSIRARFSQEDWGKIVKPLQDQLRKNKRDALIAYLLVQPDLIKWGVVDADSLFEFLLIDVQMGPCLETSRIKQAISTVQVFVQRCFSGLEKRYVCSKDESGQKRYDALKITLDHKRWEWMKNYRMWEANRKVFLYPENWIEPSLRDDKSPFFLEFEADLVKKDLDSKSMQDAVKNYISRVGEVANLLPVTLLVETTIIHLFARTRSTPCVYYYRSYDQAGKQWKPWEKMDVEIQYHDDPDAVGQGGAFLIPAMIGSRLIVFTPQIVKQLRRAEEAVGTGAKPEKKPVDTTKALPMVEYFEIKLGWSEYRNGKWTPKQLSSEAVRSKPQENLLYPVRRLHFSLADTNERGAKIVIDDFGTFELKDGCCTVLDKAPINTDNTWGKAQFNKIDVGNKSLIAHSSGWNVGDNPPSLSHGAHEWQYKINEVEQNWKDDRARSLGRMETLNRDMLLIFTNPSSKHIPLTYGPSTGILAHTTASSTLDQLFNSLHESKAKNEREVITKTKLEAVELATTAKTDLAAATKAKLKAIAKEKLEAIAKEKLEAIAQNELESPFGLYDWELGFHAPSILMDKLASSHQYEKALEISRFVFNPMASGADDTSPDGVWKWAPFRKPSARESFQQFLGDLKANEPSTKVNEWRNTPFQPHAVARGRPVAYMTWMVMRYIKILIAAGDQLFRQETMESMPLAIQYYTLAAHLYGPPSQDIPKHTKRTPKTFNTLMEKWDAFSNAMVSFENAFPFTNTVGAPIGGKDTGFSLGYFCVPRNPAIRDLRTQIDDRLYKIRHCQDINGITHQLALFEPPIDPGALVRAAASGLSLSSMLKPISGPMPNYRFQYLLRGALEMVQELKSLAGAFLSAKEKLDSEAYQRIRAGHESTINAVVLDLKKLSRNEAKKAIESLRNSREGPLSRLNHFLQLVGQDVMKTSSEVYKPVECSIEKPTGTLMMTESENLETTLSHVASGLRAGATGLAGIAEFTRVIPTPEINTAPMGVGMSVRVGPKNVAKGFRGAALAMEVTGQVTQHLSDSAARTNMFTRQYQDRVLQANSAGLELNAINSQIQAQEVRVSIAEKDIELQEKQIETAKATEEYLRSKYTNEALYSWQETQLRTLHYQTYTVAYDLAKKVERSYQFERGLTDAATNFIVSKWDSSRDGLLSAEGLGLGLKRLESAYQESRGHDFEITKHISLRQINPKALLKLRSTNSCEFSLPETLFDMDFPGHHTRRIKSVSISLPCVVGPYTSVNCTLVLKNHSYRLGTADKTTDKEGDYVPISSVAFSSGQNDPGVFELNFHDERYLPFEGAGVISSWNLSLPEFRSFDYNTISDVIMHLRYTSITGAGTDASTRLKGHLAAGKTAGSEIEGALYASFDLRNEFASTWQHLAAGRPMTLSDLNGRLPWWTTKYNLEVVEIQLLTSTAGDFKPPEGEDEFVFQITPDAEEPKGAKTGDLIDGMTTFTIETGITAFGTWKLTMAKQEFALTDLWMVVQYKTK